MQPDTPQPAQSPHPSDYDFFMNSPAPQKPAKFSFPTGGDSKPKRLLIIFGGGGLMLILVMMLLSIFTGGSNRGEQLLSLAQQQVELIRVADLTKTEPAARGTATQVLAVNTSVTISSSNQEVLALIKKSGTKYKEAQLALKKNVKTDAKLTAAAENNTYDSVFKETIDSQLKAYQTTAKSLYTSAKSQAEKAVLEEAYNGAGLLLGQKTE